ncbi:hypothetical protein BGZ47_001485, partial [Haplosporangium gracile]
TQGQDPLLPALPPGLSPAHSEMFRVALNLLRGPGDITKKKSVLSKTVDDLRADLQAALYPDPDDPAVMSIESLQKFAYESLLQCVDPRLTRASKEKYLVLKIVSQVLHWLENDNFAAPLSEHVFVSAWSDILNTLFAQSGLRGIPGELGSRASRDSRSLAESVFGGKMAISSSSRKVDLTIRIFVDKSWADEIYVLSVSPKLATYLVCQAQQGNSVHPNTAILLTLEEKGLDITQWYPIIAEIRALSIDFYTLRRYGDVIGADRATHEKVWLPSGTTKLDAFLSSRSFEVLLGFWVGPHDFVCQESHCYTCVVPSHTTLDIPRRPRFLLPSYTTLNVYTCRMAVIGVDTLDLFLTSKHAGYFGVYHPFVSSISRSRVNPSSNVGHPQQTMDQQKSAKQWHTKHRTNDDQHEAPQADEIGRHSLKKSKTSTKASSSWKQESPPQRPTTSPPRKRDHSFVLFSSSKSQQRGHKASTDYDTLIVQDDDDLAL